mgnify:CR=1 FL=1
MIKTLLENHIEKNAPDNEIAVLLSGGVDSISVAFAAANLGKKNHAYSFRLDTHTSYDFEKAKEIAKQFDWSARYAGNDNIFAQQDIRFADKSNNPYGLDPNDASIDDVLVLAAKDRKGAIVVPADTAVALKITSMDVIHSFKVLPLRVCKDAIPGLQLPIHFKVKTEYLDPDQANKDGEHVFLITCAQLCGDGHGSMNGYLKVVSKEKFKQWLEAKSNAAKQARRENLAAAK